MPFNPRNTWGVGRTPKPITSSERRNAKVYGFLTGDNLNNDITVWRNLYYTKPEDVGMGKNPFLRDRWNLSKRKLGIVAGINMNTDHETIEEEFPGNLKGLKEAENYCIQKLLEGEDESYHILCMGLSKDREDFGEIADNFMLSIRRDGIGWW